MAARTAAGAAAAIRPRSFWAMLNNAERAELTDRSVSQVLMPAVALTLQGDPSDRIYVLLHGFVKATTVVPKTGLEVILRVYGPGDIIGCDFMIPDQRHLETALPLTRGRAISISIVDFSKYLDRFINAARAALIVMQQRIQDADTRAAARTRTAKVRIAQLLVNLAEDYGIQTANGTHIPVPLSQSELASLAGDSRETVARVLWALRDEGLVATGYRRISVADMPGLRKLAAAME